MADVTELIEQEHREVEALFAQFKQGPDKKIAMKICEELDHHTDAEEKVLYSVMRKETGDEELVAEAEKEHKEARQLIGRIKQTEDTGHLSELVTELEAAVAHHVEEEEKEMLPKARQQIDSARLEEMGAEFQAAKG